MSQKPRTDEYLVDLTSISTMFSFLFCILASNMLMKIPLIGGALYLLGRVAFMYGKWLHPISFGLLDRKQKRIAYFVLLVTLVIALLLVVIVPVAPDNTLFWLLMLIVFIVTVRPMLAKHRLDADIAAGRKPIKMLTHVILVQILLLVVLGVLLRAFSAPDTAWSLIGGYFVTTVFDAFALWRDRYKEDSALEASDVQAEMDQLSGAHAYKTFDRLLLLTSAALQVTLIMSYAFIACTAGEMILCMALAAVCTYAAYLFSGLLLKGTVIKRSPDPSNVLLAGLALWILGILMFSINIVNQSLIMAYLSLALCAGGAGLAVRVLTMLEKSMRDVVFFALGREPDAKFDRAVRFRIEFASLCGQLLALLGITLICVFNLQSFPDTLYELARSIRPLLVVPTLLLVFAALFVALLFPMTKQHLDKLHKFVEMSGNGENNPALRSQLEDVVLRRSIKRYGVKILMAILRPMYRHRLVGRENVPNDPDTPMIFVCNHGEIYGPIVTNLYVPYAFRPWVINDMMDKQAIYDSTLKGALTRFPWIPERMRPAVARAVSPIIAWLIGSIDPIPVYYNEPRKLMGSFRESIAAMEAGDNILLFPENSDDTPDHHYQLGGVSHFYTGFTMLGQLYYNKTGKRAYFVPIYADKVNRTINFGLPTRYDPDIPANDEKERLCEYLRGEMLRMAQKTRMHGKDGA